MKSSFTWLNTQGVRGSSGFELQRLDRFTMSYTEGNKVITIDVENGSVGSKYAILMSSDALDKWDNGLPLDRVKRDQVLKNIQEALAFQDLELSLE
jgi:hypothetical protein